MTHPWVTDNNWMTYYSDSTLQWEVMAWRHIFSICVLWPWSCRYDLGSRSWHILGSLTTTAYIIQIQNDSEELWSGHGFWVCVYCDPDLRDMTLVSSYDTILGHGKPLCEVLFRSYVAVAVRNYSRRRIFSMYVVWPWSWRYDLGPKTWHTPGQWQQ